MPPISPSVDTVMNLMEIIYKSKIGQSPVLLEIVEQMIPFIIDFGVDMVSDLSCCFTQTYAFIERRGSKPKRATLGIQLSRAPKPNVMPLTGIIADRLLKRFIFFASPQVQIAYRCIFVGAAEDGVGGDFKVSLQAKRIRWIPTTILQDRRQLVFGTDESYVERISRVSVASAGNSRSIFEGWMPRKIPRPDKGDQHVCRGQITNRDKCEPNG